MPIKNNYVEASELIRRKRLSTIYVGNAEADARKFRALTRFSRYDPSVRSSVTSRATGEVCNDSCRTGEKSHNTFAATQVVATRFAHFSED